MAITWTWNGVAVAGARTSGAVWTVRDYEIGPMVFRPRVQQLDMLQGEWETYSPIPEPRRSWRVTIQGDVTAIAGNDTEGELAEGWEEAAGFWDPLAGAGWLTATRTNGAGTSIVRKLKANVLTVPEFRIMGHEPKGLGESGAYNVTGAPYIVYRAQGDTRFPYWVRSTLLTTDTGAAAAELAVSGSTDTVTINNPGVRWAGCKVTVKAGSTSGSVTGFTITNNTNGDVMALSRGSAFVNSEYLDWFASDPLEITKDSDWRYSGAGGKLRIDPGDNTLQVVRDAGAGTLTLELAWPAYYYTL